MAWLTTALSRRVFDAFALVVIALGAFAMGGCKSIPEGRSSVNEVQIRGAKAIDEDDIEDKIATTSSTKFLLLFRGVLYEYSLFDRFVLQRDLARIEAFYRTKGYYDVHARAGRVHQIDKDHVRVEIVVEEGDPVLVRQVHVDGLDSVPKAIADGVRTAASTGLPTDKALDQDVLAKTEGLVRRALTDNGYAYAKVSSDAAADIVMHKADIVFSVTPGLKCTFGEVRLEGQGTLPTKALLRTINITPGEEYSQKVLDDAQQALLDLGVLASVELVPDARASPTQTVVPIVVKLEPSRLRTIQLGGGVEFDALKTDVHGIIGWENRNFFGGLRSFNVQFRPGVVLYPTRVSNLVAPSKPLPEEKLRFEFKQPGFPEARTNLFDRPEFNVYPVLLNPDPPVNERVIGYGEFRNAIGLERTFWKLYGEISHNTQVAYPFSYVGPKDPTLGLIVISYPELYITLDFRDDKVHPRKGIFLGNTLQVAGGVFGGDAKDFKVQPEARGYIPITKHLVLATRGSVGFLEPSNYGSVVQNGPSGAEAASADRTRDYQLTFFRGFFSGGPTSNRGYPIRGVGPYDVVPFLTPDVELSKLNSSCGQQCRTPTGGFTLWEASAELRYTIFGPLSVATFCDASDVSPQTNDIRITHPHLSCGGGGRYDTPAGPIRVDIGYRIPGAQVIGGLTPDEREPDRLLGIPIAVHIGIGEAY